MSWKECPTCHNMYQGEECPDCKGKANQKPGYLYSGPGYTPSDKEYHVKYMEKGTYKTLEKDLTARELTEFYQQKPYEQIIDVHKIRK